MNLTEAKEKKIAASISVVSNSFLILLKFIAGFISGSIGIISEAIHSASDLLASIIAFISVSESSKPADEEHQFGHEKHEDFASLIEGALIILAAFYIVYESFRKIFSGAYFEINTNLGLSVMLFSVVLNFLVSSYLFKVSEKTGSVALYADGMHLRTDIYSSLAVFIGLLFVKYTGNSIYDPIIAIIVALIIFVTGYNICKIASRNLLDTSLSQEKIEKIEEIIENNIGEKIISLKNLRTRKCGKKKNIEITLIVKKNMQIGTSHELCDKIEAEIEGELTNTDISIHLEPGD